MGAAFRKAEAAAAASCSGQRATKRRPKFISRETARLYRVQKLLDQRVHYSRLLTRTREVPRGLRVQNKINGSDPCHAAPARVGFDGGLSRLRFFVVPQKYTLKTLKK